MTPTPTGTFTPPPASSPTSTAPSPDGGVPGAPLSSGALDPSFGTGGKVTGTGAAIRAVALQADGKIVALGGLTLRRYNADGTVDATFGTGGAVQVVTGGGNSSDAMRGLAIQGDQKIVVVGSSAAPTSSNEDVFVARYATNGTLDPTFGTGGTVTTDVAGFTDRAYAVVIQPDGALVVAGSAGASLTDSDVAVLRYTSTGAPDLTFGTAGHVTTNVAGQTDFGYAVALQANGSIVVAGRVAASGGADPDFGIVRYSSLGVPDPAFGTAGVARFDFANSAWDEASDVAISSDDKILVGGFVRSAGVYAYALARLTAGGARDATFGTNGLVTTAFTGKDDYARGLALAADGKIVLAGNFDGLGKPDFGIARYTKDGVLDATFGKNGQVAVDFFGDVDIANDVLIDKSGMIVLGGSAKQTSSAGPALARIAP